MSIIISHSHYLHVTFMSVLVFPIFVRMIFGRLSFPGERWYVVTVRGPQMVRDGKKFGNRWFKVMSCGLELKFTNIHVAIGIGLYQ